jgi:hypothetical protein
MNGNASKAYENQSSAGTANAAQVNTVGTDIQRQRSKTKEITRRQPRSAAGLAVPLKGQPKSSAWAIQVGPTRSARRSGHDIAMMTSGRAAHPETLRPGSGNREPQRTRIRRRFPERRLHLIDIENLAGDSLPSLHQVRKVQGRYTECLTIDAMDQIEVASSHLTLVNAALGWPHAHYRVRSGPDGADLALLDILQQENIARRFTHVVIGSGDHLFADDAAHLAAQGIWVTVVGWRHSLSPQLALAAHEVIFLDTAAEAA